MVSTKLVMRAVCDRFNLTLAHLRSDRRDKFSIRARHIAMYLARTLTAESYPSIALEFGGKDHTTVLLAVRNLSHRLDKEPDLALELNELTQTIMGHAVRTGSVDRCPHCLQFYVPPEKREGIIADIKQQITDLSSRLALMERL